VPLSRFCVDILPCEYQYNVWLLKVLRRQQEFERSTRRSKQRQLLEIYKFEAELILRDYDKVNELQPDFAFAYFNKANILASQQDLKSAIQFYSKSIEAEPEFAEAYYNRGLTYLFIGEDEKGLADLSKAGELGIYKVYNLIHIRNIYYSSIEY
jgi:tetratricopeptide (TPR) repeat protein